ncbi:MAG TPA: helix-turn-helix domain-containing protein [Planctomycetaceae bacterium]|nr:helix-turn-helix domain-containing protein [Planctomycetaceae bacterium]
MILSHCVVQNQKSKRAVISIEEEEEMTNDRRSRLFERLKQGLEEGIQHAKGELTLRTVEVPEEPPEIDAKTLAALRDRAAMSQAVFAKMLNVSTKTLQSWEQGVRQPSDASRRLIQIFSSDPEVICRSAGLPEIRLKGVAIEQLPQGRRRIVVKQLGNETKKSRRVE